MSELKKIIDEFVKDKKPERTWREAEAELRRTRDPKMGVTLPYLRFLEND